MRIGAFEVDFLFQTTLSMAAVYSGKAPLLRSVRLRNVRGSELDWLKITAVISGSQTRQKAVRNLPVHAEEAAAACEKELAAGLLVPPSLSPGRHEGELRIFYQNGEKTIPFSLNILSSSWMPTDLAHACDLAAWIRPADDFLRGFAAEALQEADDLTAFGCIRALYDALSRKNLMYQPVSSSLYPDFQPVSNSRYTLEKGGSCADLSLLMASLLWIRGFSPVLLLYEDHMTAGCFSGDFLPDFEMCENPEQIAGMVGMNQLILPEMTGICSYQQLPFSRSLEKALEELREKTKTSGCCLVNLKAVLRNGTVRLLPDDLQSAWIHCPHCGYDRIAVTGTQDEIICPACGGTFCPEPEEKIPEASESWLPYDPGQLRYEIKSQQAGVVKCLTDASEPIRVLPRWQNRPVTYIAARAFENSRLSEVILPDTMVEIRDRAFRGCENLASVQLPADLSGLGSGAFSSSALVSIRIPGSVSRIPVLCFSSCAGLKTVILEEGIRQIDQQAFIHCPELKCVYLPVSLRKISRSAFDPSCRLVFASSQAEWF